MMEKETVNYIFIALGAILLLCLALMAFFSYLASHIRDARIKRALTLIAEESAYNPKKPKHSKRGDDFISKDKVAEKKKQEEKEMGVVKYNVREQEMDTTKEQNDTQIVGVVEAKGFWSRFVMKQKMGFIIAMGGLQSDKKGYWQNFIKAQAASQGKDQTKGR